MSDTSNRHFMQGVVSIIITIGFLSLILFLCLYTVPKENQGSLNILTGTLSSLASAVVGYWLGSSLHSLKKDPGLTKGGKIL